MAAGGRANDPHRHEDPINKAKVGGYRRGKAALFVACCGLAGIAPHWLPTGRSLVPAISLAGLLGSYSLRTLLYQAFREQPANSWQEGSLAVDLPSVDVVVAARDEQAVISLLVERVASLRWPRDRLRLWVVDDGSDDHTPELLRELQGHHSMLQVLHRPRDAGGGKSAALNVALERLPGRWMLVLDADADLQADLLERLIPYAEKGGWAAVQLRKAVANVSGNLLTRAQAMEMAFDAVVQEGRLATGGVTELRGNGQLLRRDALLTAGGFNESTVTDDLDLSFRFLLASLPIGLLWNPPVREEAVVKLPALWRQRQRWAEGGLQRFFDYWPELFSGRLRCRQKLDLACFFLLQYGLPGIASADLVGSLLTRTAPTMWPLSIVALGLSGLAITAGCRRPSEGPPLPTMTAFNLALGVVYLTHWFLVIPWVTLKMALLPKKLVWAKTQHVGTDNGSAKLVGLTTGGDPTCRSELDEQGDQKSELAPKPG